MDETQPTIAEVIQDLRDHAEDALAEIGHEGAPTRTALQAEHDKFQAVARWLEERYTAGGDA